jgi:hypothetical protein
MDPVDVAAVVRISIFRATAVAVAAGSNGIKRDWIRKRGTASWSTSIMPKPLPALRPIGQQALAKLNRRNTPVMASIHRPKPRIPQPTSASALALNLIEFAGRPITIAAV